MTNDALIDGVVASANLAYVVNPADDSFEVLRFDSDVKGKGVPFGKFSEAVAYFLDVIVKPCERERMSRELDYATLRERTAREKSYDVDYFAMLDGVPVGHEMQVVALGDGRVVIGFARKDVEVVLHRVSQRRFDENFAMFVVDLDTEKAEIVKNDGHYRKAKAGSTMPYRDLIGGFVEDHIGETREFFRRISDLDYVRKILATDDKRTYCYQSPYLEGKWIDVTSFVLERHEDGSPAIVTLGFSKEDMSRVDRHEAARRIREDMEIIGGLATSFTALYRVDLATGEYRNFVATDRIADVSSQFAKFPKFIDLVNFFVESDLVHPDSRETIRNLYSSGASIREALAGKKRISAVFQRKYPEGFLWTKVSVVKCEPRDEEARTILVAFNECDDEVRSEQALRKSLVILERNLAPDPAINELLAHVGDFYAADRAYIFEYGRTKETMSNTYEWCRDGIEPMIGKLQDQATVHVEGWIREFERQGAFYMDALDSEQNTEDTRRILEMQGIRWLVAAPILQNGEVVGFIGVDNPARSRREIRLLRAVAAVAYAEIIKRREDDERHVTLGKLADAFVSVYYCDLSRDYIRTWKIADEYREAYGSVSSYTESMIGYMRTGVVESDRARCVALAGPEHVREEFRTKDRFSVETTDILLGHERNIVFDFIKVSADGNEFVVCCRDVTDTVREHRTQREKLEAALKAAEEANRRLETANRHERLRADVLGFIQKKVTLEDFVDFFSQRALDLYGCDQVIYRDVEGRMIIREKPGTPPLDFSLCKDCPHFAFDAEVYGDGFTAMDDCSVGWHGIPVHPGCPVKASLTYLVHEDERVFGYVALHYIGRAHAFTDDEKATFDRLAKLMSVVLSRRKQRKVNAAAIAALKEKDARFEVVKGIINAGLWCFKVNARDEVVAAEYSGDIPKLLNVDADLMNVGPLVWTTLVHPDDIEAARKAFYATISDHTGGTPYDVVYRMSDRDGKYNWFHSAGSVIRHEDGTGDFFGIHINITKTIETERAQQEKILELERKAAQAKIDAAEETSRAKTAFLANMSHDIRTPMNAIIGFSDIAQRHVREPERVEGYLEKVKIAGSHLLEIINDILDMSKIDSRDIEITEYPARISQMPRYFSMILSQRMKEHGHAFVCEATDYRDDTLWIDKPHLNRIVVNLLSNAIKYTPDGGKILFRVTQLPDRDDQHARFRIVVEDNGIGMSEEFQRHLFERFTREKNSTVSGIQGTGIGMAIAKSLTDAMGGTIAVESKEGAGTKFTLEFDFRRRRPGEGEVEEEGQRSEVKGQTAEEENLNHHCRTTDLQPPPSRPAKRILLVEDNEINREIALEILRNAGYEVDVAVNGREAVEKVVGVKSWSGRADENFHSPTPAQNSNYDLILMDIMMPVMNGLEAAKAIRAAGSAVPIVALSANAFTEDREASLAAGMNDHLSKPIKVRELLECIAKFESEAKSK